jgi:hypothetical protein
MRAAREQVRETLKESPSFASMPLSEQKTMYMDLVKSLARQYSNGGVSQAMAKKPTAGDLIDDSRHVNKRIDQAGDIAGDYVQAVNFPGFVKDLLKGVFDANLAVTIQQMEAYQKLLKTSTESISKFVNAIDNTAAFGYLAENQGDDFNLDFSDDDEDKNSDGTAGMVLTDKDGNKLASANNPDVGDNELKTKIMDAKIAMAREQRALLRETILMGITRLVVERGNVKASVVFDFKANEKIQKQDKAGTKDSSSTGSSFRAGGGLIGSIFGGPSGGVTHSSQSSQITVSSAKSAVDTSLQAKLAGSVDITFKSDYFKLDNFATMYGPGAGGAAAPTASGGAPAPGGAPAAPAR